MIRLLRAEWLRLRSRRAAVVLMVLIGLIGALILIGLAVDSSGSGPTAEELARARAEYRELIQYCENAGEGCSPEYLAALQVEDFYDDPRFVLGQDAEVPLFAYGVLLVLLSLVVATTYIGSEWHHNTVGHLLTWEPRRSRVLLAKATVVLTATAAATFTLLLLFLCGLWVVAATRGVTAAPSGFFGTTVGDLARVAATAGLFASLAVGLASIARNTAASLGILLAYLAVVERFLEAVRPRWRPWLPGNLGAALFTGKLEIDVPDPSARFGIHHIEITALEGAVVLLVYATVLVTAAVFDFRRRDVT